LSPRSISARYALLDTAWASNSVNTAAFRHSGIFTSGRYQYASYYKSPSAMTVVRRDLHSRDIIRHDIPGSYNLWDAHNCISMGMDPAGHLHISYDHHASELRYRRSLRPGDVTAWTDEIPMNTHRESKVTYPTFLTLPNGPLIMLYRDGQHDRGSAILKYYDHENCSWNDEDVMLLTGATNAPWSSSPYWNHPAIDQDGGIHLAFSWRMPLLGEELRVSNVNVDYARSPDTGRSWFSTRGLQFNMPITQINSETILAVPPGSNLINQGSMAVSPKGTPHIVFYSDDDQGIPQYQHLWRDGWTWRCSVLSCRKDAFVLRGRGTLKIPIGRPEVVVDRNERVYILFRGDLTGDRLMAQRLLPPHYHPDPDDVRLLWASDLDCAETVIDRERWRDDSILSILIQKNAQPPHDAVTKPVYEPIYLAEWNIAEDW